MLPNIFVAPKLPPWWKETFADGIKITNDDPKSATVLDEREHGELGRFQIVHQQNLFKQSSIPAHRVIILGRNRLLGEAIYRDRETAAVVDSLEARPENFGIGPALLSVVGKQTGKPITLIARPEKIHFYEGCGLEFANPARRSDIRADGGYVMRLPTNKHVARGGLLDASWVPAKKVSR